MDGLNAILKNGLTKPKVLLALAALITVLGVIFTIWGLTLEHPHDSVRPVIFTAVLAWLAYLSTAKLFSYAVREARGYQLVMA
jgi:hypothetical protein